jgi:hypothetical protein
MTGLPETILDTLHDLERRLVAIERSPQLTSASIKEGALDVLDAAGMLRVRIGKDGSDYGVKVYDAAGANPVSLATLAFAQSAARVGTEQDTTSTAYTDLATAGPSVTVTVGASGRAIVLAGAYAFSSVSNQSAYVGLKIDAAAAFDFALLGNNTGGSMGASVAGGDILDDLSPGPHTFKLQYRQSLAGANVAGFGLRWLVVFPL